MKEWDFRYYEFIGFILISLILLFFLYPKNFFIQDRNFYEKKIDINLKKEKIYKDNFENTIKKSSLFKEISKETVIENKVLRIKISNKGGQIKEVLVKNFKNNNPDFNKNIFLIKKNFSFGFIFKDLKSTIYNTKFFYFISKFEETINNISVIMRAYISEKDYLEYVYILDKYGYNLSFVIRTKGLNNHIKTNSIILYWKQKIISLEKDKNWEGNSTQIYYSYGKEMKIRYLSESGFDKKELKNINWIAAKQQFFTSIFSLNSPLSIVNMKSYIIDYSNKFLKKIEIYSPIKNSELNLSSKWYFGPINYDLLKSYKKNYEKIIPFGWGILRWLNTYFFLKIFQILSATKLNCGIIIILMTVVVKLILCPITYNQYKLSAMMKIIRPELENINEEYKKLEGLKKQQMIIELYRKTGINPMSGCLPAILQIPIFYSLFKFFPTLIDLRGKNFLWTEDLTSYDSIIELPFYIPIYGNHVSLFTLLYVIVLLIYTKISNNNNISSQQGIPDMRPIMYVMPLMMLLFINNYASGLSLYYFISNLINIILIFFIKNFLINENKIRKSIEYNKNNIKEKSIWYEKVKKILKKY